MGASAINGNTFKNNLKNRHGNKGKGIKINEQLY